MTSWSIEVRAGRREDIDALGANANVDDGCAAVWFVTSRPAEPGKSTPNTGMELVAVTDEYGTAYIRKGHKLDTGLGKEMIERLVENSMVILAEVWG